MNKYTIEYSPELEELLQKGWQLIEKGLLEEALELWEQNLTLKKKVYPPALPDMIQLLIQDGQFEAAEFHLMLLEQVNQIENNDWEVPILISRVLLAYQQEDIDTALSFIATLEELDLEPEDRNLLLQLKESIADPTGAEFLQLVSDVMMEELLALAEKELLDEITEKELPCDPTLARGLKNLPVEWVNGISQVLGIEELPRRKEREKRIMEELARLDLIEDLLDEYLEEEDIALLEYVMQKGGWSRFSTISRKYGGLEGESYNWPDEGPCTPLGGLWSAGLIMVGRTVINGRRSKIVTIPVEVRKNIQTALENRKKSPEAD